MSPGVTDGGRLHLNSRKLVALQAGSEKGTFVAAWVNHRKRGATRGLGAQYPGRGLVTPCHKPPYFTFGINLANSGSGMNPSRLGISILGRLSLSSVAFAGTMPFKFKM